ncbi:hypothetical protein [Streptomyces sp. NBC_01465]|uniref:hypothetical protein n=1 Tax=Streptomyces sp. NBC_01465 TaxID=2903878 RepID=UPI002E357CF7|nr:hypothetical protein [Streptomyces sp. NBC_01465]
MKYTKVAAAVAGTVLALGMASPALADDGNLVDSSTVSKNVVKNPLKTLKVEALVGAVSKVADKVKATNNTDAATKVGAAQR